MHNYEHEISCPDNRAIRKYLWQDYFHDSKIMDVKFDKVSNRVVLILESFIDLNNAFEKLKMDHKEFWEYVNENIDRFTYELTFTGAEHIQMERDLECNDYINGRFKKTALLDKMNINAKKKLYHFRISADGFIDIIFSDFSIRKKRGRVDYKIPDVFSEHTQEKSINKLEVVRRAKQGEDFDRYLAMQELYIIGYPGLLDIARHNLCLDDDLEEACLYACYLIGVLGDQGDIGNLLNIYYMIECYYRFPQYLIKRNILDAIEKIQERFFRGNIKFIEK